MDIEEFYDADERRRSSEELELGDDWHDADGQRYTLNYVVETGELYLMSAPDADAVEDPFGDYAVDDESVDELTVRIVAVVPTADDLHQALDGWAAEMGKPGSTSWLDSRLSAFTTP